MELEDSTREPGISSYGMAIRSAGPLFTSGIQMAVATGIMGYVGYLADEHWGTSPWLMVVGIFFGAVAGMYLFIRTVMGLDKKQKLDGINGKS